MATPVHRALLAVDLEGSGQRDNHAVVESRRVLFGEVREAFEASGIPWAACATETAGDEMVVIVPPEFPKRSLIHPLLGHLADGLRHHNRQAGANVRLRVRVAVHAGDLLVDDYGTTGRPQTHLARLLGSKPLREALAAAPDTATVALMVSDHFYEDVVSQGHRGIDPDLFHPVAVHEKETETRGWLHVPGHSPEFRKSAEKTRPTATQPSGVNISGSDVRIRGDVFGGNKYTNEP